MRLLAWVPLVVVLASCATLGAQPTPTPAPALLELSGTTYRDQAVTYEANLKQLVFRSVYLDGQLLWVCPMGQLADGRFVSYPGFIARGVGTGDDCGPAYQDWVKSQGPR